MSDTQNKAVEYVGAAHVGDEAICIDGVSYRYPEGTAALEDINLHVRSGSTLAIVGPNGAGKTTLLKIVLGLLEGYTGRVSVLGMPPTEARRRGNVIAWVPQRQLVDWSFPVTVRQVVRMGLLGKTGMLRRRRRDDLEYAEHVMGVLQIDEIGDNPIGELSGGQQQRAVIARALVARPAVLMLDEPTIGVDQPGQAVLRQVLNGIKRAFNITLVVVSHDLRTIMSSCQRIACLNRRLHFHDAPGKLSEDTLSRVFECTIERLFASDEYHAHEGHGQK
jgi:zinc transport system ATP-binding protein